MNLTPTALRIDQCVGLGLGKAVRQGIVTDVAAPQMVTALGGRSVRTMSVWRVAGMGRNTTG